MKDDPFQIPTSAELRDGLRGDITKLTAEVARLTAELQGERDDLANARKWIDGQDVRSDFPNATAMRQALDIERERANRLDNDRAHMTLRFTEEATAHVNTLKELNRERERCGVLEREVGKWRAWCDAEDSVAISEPLLWQDVVNARHATDTRHALDAAKFVGKHE